MAEEKKNVERAQKLKNATTTTNEVDGVVGLMEKIANFFTRHGLKGTFTTFLMLILTSMVGYFVLNPGVIFDKYQEIMFERHNEAVQKRMDNDPKIRENLLNMRDELDADRAFILEAHNGGSNLSTLPFLFVDMTYESVSPGIPTLQEEYNNMRLQKYAFCEYAYTNVYWSGNVEELKEMDEHLYYRIKGDGVDYFAVLVLYGEKTVIGAIGIEYIKEPEANEKKIHQTMLKYGSRLTVLLNNGK